MDRDSDFGSKGCGPDKNWKCLKNDGAVAMESGPIARVAVTRASVPDAKGLALVCPCGGEACADKAWCGKDGLGTIRARGCEERAIERSDMKGEDWAGTGPWRRSACRSSGAFSNCPSRLRYIGLEKDRFQVAAFAVARNFKRLAALGVEPIPIA